MVALSPLCHAGGGLSELLELVPELLRASKREPWVVTALLESRALPSLATARLRAALRARLLLYMDKYNTRTTLSGLLPRDKKN